MKANTKVSELRHSAEPATQSADMSAQTAAQAEVSESGEFSAEQKAPAASELPADSGGQSPEDGPQETQEPFARALRSAANSFLRTYRADRALFTVSRSVWQGGIAGVTCRNAF